MGKEQILAKIRKNKPQWKLSLPEVPGFEEADIDLVEEFQHRLAGNGVEVELLSAQSQLTAKIPQLFPEAKNIFSNIPEITSTVDLQTLGTPGELHDLDLAVLEAELGVADNGAIWLSSQSLEIRAIPFITKYLVVLVKREHIVAKMHQAYAQINPQAIGFGCFISSASKTADIEQALVVGAHGPLGHRVFLV